jgi:hypothetical protein
MFTRRNILLHQQKLFVVQKYFYTQFLKTHVDTHKTIRDDRYSKMMSSRPDRSFNVTGYDKDLN